MACEVRARSSLHGCSSACAGDVGDEGCVGERARPPPHMRPRSRVSAREETVVAAEAGYAYASTLADHIDSQSRPGTSIYSDVDVVVTENAEHYFRFLIKSVRRLSMEF